MPTARHRHLVPLMLIAALATACGSTVQGTSTVSGGAPGSAPGGGDGLGGPGQVGASAGPGSGVVGSAGSTGGSFTAGSTGGGTSGGSTGFSGSGSGTTGGSTGSFGTSTGGASSTPGVTAKEVYVGLVYDDNAGAVNQAAGVGSITTGDSKANARAIIADINKHGGVGGRKLVPVFARFDSTSSQTIDQQYSAICQQFTQDNPRVFVVNDDADLSDSYRACLAKAGVGTLSTSLPLDGAAILSRYPGLIQQGYPNVDRLAAYEVTPLVDQKYFTPWDTLTGQPAATGKVKVGILTYNDAVFAPAVDHILVPALKKLGYDPEVEKVAQINTAADYSAQGSAVKAAQLRFAANGVTHIIPFEANGGLSTLFLPTARSQNYYPRYGISSSSAFEALLETGIVDKKQMTGAVGFGWLPSVDLPSRYNPQNSPFSNANRRYCLNVLKASGITFDSGNAETVALNSCSDLYLLKAALDKTAAQISLRNLIGTIESLGTSYQRAGGLGQTFRPGRHDPTDKAYHWRYFADCNCFHYEGALQTVP